MALIEAAARAVLVSFVASAIGCGGAAAEPARTPQDSAPMAKEVGSLRMHIRPSQHAQVNEAVRNALASAGYMLVLDERSPAEVLGQLSVAAVEERSFLQMQVNGVRQTKHQVTVTLALTSGGAVVETASCRFTAENGQVSPDQVACLVSALNKSEKLRQLGVRNAELVAKKQADEAAKQAAAQAEAERKRADEEARRAAESARRAEDDRQFDSMLAECRAPKTAKSCEPVRSWLTMTSAKGRGGREDSETQRRRSEAELAMSTAGPALKQLAEADLWSRIEAAKCHTGTIDSDCPELTEYLLKHSDGPHIADARKAGDVRDKRLAARAAAEEQRQRADERAAAQRAQQGQCKAKCETDSCIAFTQKEKKAECVASCIQRCQ